MRTDGHNRLADTLKGIFGFRGGYSEAAGYLAEHGYNDGYIEMLRSARDAAKTKKSREEGSALIAQGLLFKGDLTAAAAEFEQVDMARLPRAIVSVFANNYMLCLFLLDKFSAAEDLYKEQNKYLLSENSLAMRRTIGIKEHIAKRYENAVTVFVKALAEDTGRGTLMIDICIVRSMIRLDMYDRAREIAEKSFSSYYGKGELTALVKKLEMKIQTGLRRDGLNSAKGGGKRGKGKKKR